VRLWLTAVIRAHDFDAEVAELDTATLAIQGPRSTDVIDALGLDWFDELDRFEQRPTTMRLDDGPAVEVVVSRSGWSTQGGCEIFLDDATRAVDLWNTVASAGEPFDIGPGAPNATERIENVLLSYGTDTGYDADPIELGLTDHLDLDRPDFIGQTALRLIRDQGPARRLRGVVIDGDEIDVLQQPVPFTIGGECVGRLRAATPSPRFGRNIGLALIDASCTPGDVGTVELADGERTAHLVDLPFAESLED
jgi:aminomethyltransferase